MYLLRETISLKRSPHLAILSFSSALNLRGATTIDGNEQLSTYARSQEKIKLINGKTNKTSRLNVGN